MTRMVKSSYNIFRSGKNFLKRGFQNPYIITYGVLCLFSFLLTVLMIQALGETLVAPDHVYAPSGFTEVVIELSSALYYPVIFMVNVLAETFLVNIIGLFFLGIVFVSIFLMPLIWALPIWGIIYIVQQLKLRKLKK